MYREIKEFLWNYYINNNNLKGLLNLEQKLFFIYLELKMFDDAKQVAASYFYVITKSADPDIHSLSLQHLASRYDLLGLDKESMLEYRRFIDYALKNNTPHNLFNDYNNLARTAFHCENIENLCFAYNGLKELYEDELNKNT